MVRSVFYLRQFTESKVNFNHAEIGTPIQVLMATAGHLSQKMTELYTHISQRSMQEAADRYEQRKAERLAEARAKLALEQRSQPISGQVN
jgi:thiamine pyrophosphate-dependent acetolactate synthase large subunit-like protein